MMVKNFFLADQSQGIILSFHKKNFCQYVVRDLENGALSL